MADEHSRTKARMYCLDCDYPLDALKSDQCPECGLWFDYRDPRTFAASPSKPITRWIERKWFPLLSFVAVAGSVFLVVGGLGLIGMVINWMLELVATWRTWAGL
jgi:hypothetical protein